jgi:hypothetical protein
MVWWRSLKTKSDDSRQRQSISAILLEESLVLCLRLVLVASLVVMMLMQLAIGTKGKRATASNETIFSSGDKEIFFIFSSNSVEFLQIRWEPVMSGLSGLFPILLVC